MRLSIAVNVFLIGAPMTVGLAERDPAIKVIVLRGAGRAFSGGYDFGGGFQHWGDAMMTDGRWDPGKDFAMVSARETGPTHKFMAIWRASKPVIAQVHGWCVGGASDYALCADIVIASDDAVIGTPYARMWGAYLSGMWLYRLSFAKAKWHSLTGEPLTGKELQKELSGQTWAWISKKSGTSGVSTYFRDGRVIVQLDGSGNRPQRGHWLIKEDQICIAFIGNGLNCSKEIIQIDDDTLFSESTETTYVRRGH